MRQYRLFQMSATAIMAIFFGLMFFVTFKAYSRKSGATGLDMAKVQMMLAEGQKKGK